MKIEKQFALLFFLFGILPFVSSATYSGAVGSSGFSGSTSWQSYTPTFNQIYSSGEISDYWPILKNLESDQCEATSDFVIGIPPGGCTPTVVRSDLLAEQNVPVFCQLYAIKINPLIKVSSIKSISFKGDYPDGVSGVTFHPARAAVKSYTTLLGDPIINNIGYVVIILKRERVEANMEDWIAGNLTATIYYDAEEAFGTGRSEYYVPVISEEKWQEEYKRYSFWNGIGYLRVRDISGGTARIDVMKSNDDVVRSFNLEEGETSGLLYFPGYYCRAGLRVKLNGVVSLENTTLLNINGEEFWVREGSKIINDQCTIKDIIVNGSNRGSVEIACPGQKFKLSISEKNGSVLEESFGGLDSEFDDSLETLNELLDEYGSVKKDFLDETYGEEALYEQIILAGNVGKLKTQYELMGRFLEIYPNSVYAEKIKVRMENMDVLDYSNSYSSVLVSNKFNTISVVDFEGYNSSDKKVVLGISEREVTLTEKEVYDLTSIENITATKINYNEVKLEYVKNEKGKTSRESVTIKDGGYGSLGGRNVYVKSIDVEAAAYISLLPEVKSTKTEANFTFNIGIEKRAIELSPEKTSEMIKNLNETIKKWEEINERLNNLVKGWKGACFATSGVLMVKNMISGLSGESLARQKVMVKYKELCENNPQYSSKEECYDAYATEIERDVSDMTKALNSVNDVMDESIDKNSQTKGLLGEGTIVNQTAYVDSLRDSLGSWEYTFSDLKITLNQDDLTTAEQVRVALLEKSLRGSFAYEVAGEELEKELRNVALSKQSQAENDAMANQIKSLTGIDSPSVQSVTSKEVRTLRWGKDIANSQLAGSVSGLNRGDKIQFLNLDGRMYLLKLKEDLAGSNMYAEKIYLREGSGWVDKTDTERKTFEKYVFSQEGSGSCSNSWPEGTAKISYYESGNVKGLPGIVPFDLKNGWYVMVPNSGGTFLDTSVQGYTASGDVSYFKICNIGSNRKMESGLSDDLCQTFDINSAGSVDKFIPCPSLTSTEVKNLYNNAREAIRQASAQKDQKVVTILNQKIDVGSPMSAVTGFECQDFMSPQDCKILFNVCDPVICPASRCDLGGKMPVSDVIQTGIIGSLILCLPNFQEGVIVPICVSGVVAGIDAFVSILESERDCLQWSLETGEHVGICDEITAIYMCEFFWRQFSPVMDILVPKLIANLYGGSSGVRGGGEYLLVQNAWDNLQKSVDYFQNTYAPNAFKAFQIRSIDEAGSEVCKAFIGTSFPSSAEGIESLLEPESPSQFYAQFSEVLFSEATVPSTSQYKVYYHIYAGKDKGVQYRVYLKNPPASSYYASSPIINVKTGFVALGNSADESIDFTAPSGYKELCVVIDAEEWCGFGQVSTDLGINYLADKYVEEQAEKEGITTEKECISGSPSVLSMANLNLQSGVEDTVDSEIALKGIVRVCASVNPGVSVDSTRWKDVGYCGEVNTRCWLDISSVEDSLEDIESVEGTSISLIEENSELLEGELATQEEVESILSKARTDIKNLDEDVLRKGSSEGNITKIFNELDKVIGITGETGGAGTNANKAEALALKLSVYRMIVMSKLEGSTPDVGVVQRNLTECEVDEDCGIGYCSEEKKCVVCLVNEHCAEGQECLEGECYVKSVSVDEFECRENQNFEFVLSSSRTIYIRYGNEGWEYSFDKNVYYKITTQVTKLPELGEGVTLSSFRGKDLAGGCEILKNREG
ncbi:MAG: hypothetical protein WC494_01675 [Candidatus Pacearchaeota archaeon]